MGIVVANTRRDAIRRKLLAWWDGGHRALPWRFPQGAADPYRVWVSEVMLQQTRVAAVGPYYARFIERFPTLAALAQASEDEVLRLWSGLGYYARGRRLHAAAREALARHGCLPASFEALLSLPGFGPYTAGAVASIAYALPVPCVDGNAARVLSRLFLVEGPLEAASARRRLSSIAGALVPRSRPGDFNQALMELGATLCGRPARCGRCPVSSHCAAHGAGRQAEVPPARRRAAPARLDLACAVVRRGDALLLARRPLRGLFGGLWELPSAPLSPGEDPRTTLRRKLASSLGLRAVAGRLVASLTRVLTHRRLHLAAYECRVVAADEGEVVSLPPGARFAAASTWHDLAISTAMRQLLAAANAVPAGPRRRGRSRGLSRSGALRVGAPKALLTRGGAPV